MEDNSLEDRDSLVEDLLIGCWREVVPMSSYDVKIKLSDREITANKDIVMTRTKYFSLTLPRKSSGTGAVDISHCSKAIISWTRSSGFSLVDFYNLVTFPWIRF